MTTDAQFIKQRLPELRLAPNELVSVDPSPETRSTPYFVRGRQPELAYLTKLIHSLPNSIHAIVGPPGTGKSTLLSYLALYAARHGYEVVQLEEEHFRSTELLVKELAPPQVESTSKTRCISGEVDQQVASGGVDRETTVTEAMLASMVDAVKGRARAADKGLVVLVDEFQNLARGNEYARDIAGTFINYMHSSVPQTYGRGKSEVPAICIVAGLLNLVEAAHELRVTRLSEGNCVRLGPIAQRHAEQVIRDHLSVRGRGIPELAKVDGADIARIAATCKGYPHHLTNAGWKAQSVARSEFAAGRKKITQEGVESIVADVNARARQLYSSRWTTLRSVKEQYAALAIADIMSGWDNRVPAPVMARAMKLVANRIRHGTEGPIDAVQLTKRMERAGVMEERSDASYFPAHNGHDVRKHYCMPIPSFATYIQNQRKEINENCDDTVEYSTLMEPGALDEDPIPAWEWLDRVQREDVADLPLMPSLTAAIRRLVERIKL